MATGSSGNELRVYRPRGFYRLLLATPRLNMAAAIMVSVLWGVVVVIALVGTGMRSGSLPILVFFIAPLALFVSNARVLWLMVREVELHPDGHLEVATSFGKRAAIRQGDVARIGPQLPYPWGRRVRTRDGDTFYFGGYERQGELIGAVYRLRG